MKQKNLTTIIFSEDEIMELEDIKAFIMSFSTDETPHKFDDYVDDVLLAVNNLLDCHKKTFEL